MDTLYGYVHRHTYKELHGGESKQVCRPYVVLVQVEVAAAATFGHLYTAQMLIKLRIGFDLSIIFISLGFGPL